VTVDPTTSIIAVLGAYLLGAVPFGLVLARFKGVDVRKAGSGNIGATNVARSAGKALGIVTLVLDAGKGALPVWLAGHVFMLAPEVIAMVGVATVVGHVFPIYLKFKGGKGVATSLGVFLVMAPTETAIGCGLFLVTFAIGRKVSLGSLVASVAIVVAIALMGEPKEVLFLALAVVALIVARHKSNIERLLRKTEHGV
jgi:acyl phosphate:glycerol-3-phosphate acyltransferase